MVASKGQKEGAPADVKDVGALCPLGKDVVAVLSAIAKNEAKKAAKLIRQVNVLPSICGRVCLAPCTRVGAADGVNAKSLRQIADAAGDAEPVEIGIEPPQVAVVGSGPAGLAAAHRLLQLGIRPVVFEAADKAGGLLADTIPAFALPREKLAGDIANLERMGAEIRLGVRIGKDLAWGELEDDFDAVLVATGAGEGVLPSIPGATLKGATTAIDFCRSAGNGADLAGKSVVVQGGSLAALQVARLAKQRGAVQVAVAHPFPLELWPAGSDEVKSAKKEGIELFPESRVTELWGYSEVEKVILQPVENRLKDGAGRSAGGDLGKPHRIEATVFIAAVNRRAGEQPKLNAIEAGLLGNLKIDTGYKLARPGWYGAGEAATGAAGIVDSMVTGRLAAEAIKKDLEAK